MTESEADILPLTPAQLLDAVSADQTPDEYRAAMAGASGAGGDAGGDAPAVQSEGDPAPAADAKAEAEPAKPDDLPVAATAPSPYIPAVREGAAERLAAIDAEIADMGVKLADLGDQLANGMIEKDEYQAGLAALAALHDEKADIKIEVALAESARRAQEHQAEVRANQEWAQAQDRFFARHPEYNEEGKWRSLNSIVMAIAPYALREGKSNEWILEAAAKLDGAPEPAKPQDPKPAARPKADPRPAPFSLSDVHGGTPPPSDPFASINARAGLDRYSHMMGLPDDQLQGWAYRNLQ